MQRSLKLNPRVGFNWVEYYFQCADQARSAYLRIGSLVDPKLPDEERAERFSELKGALAQQQKTILSPPPF